MIHELKTQPQDFEAALNGTKTHEVRMASDSFAVGDHLILVERSAGKFTGRALSANVTYVTQDQCGFPSDMTIMSIQNPKEVCIYGGTWTYAALITGPTSEKATTTLEYLRHKETP